MDAGTCRLKNGRHGNGDYQTPSNYPLLLGIGLQLQNLTRVTVNTLFFRILSCDFTLRHLVPEWL